MVSVFTDLREKYGTFLFRDYTIDRTDSEYSVEFHFEIPGLSSFAPAWAFPYTREVEPEVLSALVFQLGMAESISYFKCVCPKRFVISCGQLSKEQLAFWKKLLYNGLGEFMYRNGIDIAEEELTEFVCEGSEEQKKGTGLFYNGKVVLTDKRENEGCLVAVGGGKDSVVSLELLKQEEVTAFTINRNGTEQEVIRVFRETTGKDSILPDYNAIRKLDNRLLQLNQKGYLNGHTPFSSVVAFSSYISAYLSGKRYIILSNETSANETTVANSFVNHQYSKSFEFELDFMNYIRSVVNSEILYFSLLRPLSELQIAALFSNCRSYHKVFRSCNVGSKKGIWCCNCPKCLFVYIILTPFLTTEELHEIFGKDLLCKETLEEDFCRLTGILPDKPFECVGTRREVLASMKTLLQRGGEDSLPIRHRDFILGNGESTAAMLKEWIEENNVPEQFTKLVKEGMEQWISFRN